MTMISGVLSILGSRYQKEVDCVSFAKRQDGVDRLLHREKLPGQLGDTGRVRLLRQRAPSQQSGS